MINRIVNLVDRQSNRLDWSIGLVQILKHWFRVSIVLYLLCSFHLNKKRGMGILGIQDYKFF